MRLRPMQGADAEAVLAVQALAYPPSHHESWAVLGGRLALWPAGCWVAESLDSGRLRGYVFAHPWRLDAELPLHQVLDALPSAPDAFHLHDLALHPQAQGQGLGPLLVEPVLAAAREAGCATLSLVAVQGSRAFWECLGFEAVPGAAVGSYGADAVPMRRPLGR